MGRRIHLDTPTRRQRVRRGRRRESLMARGLWKVKVPTPRRNREEDPSGDHRE